jgi:hypothetical protein
MRRLILVAAALSVALVPAGALAATKAKVFFEDSIPSGKTSSVSIVTHRPASFRVLLRVPTAGRARLFLLGKHAPKGGPLIHTNNTSPNSSGCQGAAGSFYCKASFEPLLKGTYTWRIAWVGTPKASAHVELTVRW